jgi:hypothetical protein
MAHYPRREARSGASVAAARSKLRLRKFATFGGTARLSGLQDNRYFPEAFSVYVVLTKQWPDL